MGESPVRVAHIAHRMFRAIFQDFGPIDYQRQVVPRQLLEA